MPAITVQEVIDEARDTHSAFSRQQTGITAALRFLERWQRRVAGEIARLKPDAVHVEEIIALPVADITTGETITENYRIHGGKVEYTTATIEPAKLTIVPYARRLRYSYLPRCPAVYIRANNTVFLLGTEQAWTDYSQIVLDLFPVPGALADPASNLSLPGDPHDAAVAALAGFMAQRPTGDNSVDRAYFAADAVGAADLYLDRVTHKSDVTVLDGVEDW